jgi:hypothetical protein
LFSYFFLFLFIVELFLVKSISKKPNHLKAGFLKLNPVQSPITYKSCIQNPVFNSQNWKISQFSTKKGGFQEKTPENICSPDKQLKRGIKNDIKNVI